MTFDTPAPDPPIPFSWSKKVLEVDILVCLFQLGNFRILETMDMDFRLACRYKQDTFDSCFVIGLLDFGLDFLSIWFPAPEVSRTFGFVALIEIPRV